MYLELITILLFIVLCIFLNQKFKKKTIKQLKSIIKVSSLLFVLLLPIALFGMLFSGDSPYANSTILAISIFLFVDGLPLAFLFASSTQYEKQMK